MHFSAKNKFKLLSLVLFLSIGLWLLLRASAVHTSKQTEKESQTETKTEDLKKDSKDPEIETTKENVVHIKTPDQVKGIYISSWVASTTGWRNRLVEFMIQNNLNTVVVDIKDYTGYVSFLTGDKDIEALGTEENRIKDLKNWIEELHQKNIYVIGRISVFQDPLYTQKIPESAIKTTTGQTWRDRKGLAFVDPRYQPFWDYIIKLSKASEQIGFDELNFDYIRFPTDGNMDAMAEVTLTKAPITTKNMSIKANVTEYFFKYLSENLSGLGIPISADIFGMVVIKPSDIGIGQQLEMISKYFDYVCPMIYPSHYPNGFIGLSNPAAYPYEVISDSMKHAVNRIDRKKLRPWLQNFNLGAPYTADKIAAQKEALYDLSIHDWLLWDPANKYNFGQAEPAKRETAVINSKTHE